MGTDNQEKDEKIRREEPLPSRQPPSSKQQILLGIAMIACCGLPLLIVAGSSLAVYSFFNLTNNTILLITIAVVALAVYGARIRRRSASR